VTHEVPDLSRVLREAGLLHPGGEPYQQRARKADEVPAFVHHIEVVMKSLPQRRAVTFLDCGCGRSYLSFAANHRLREHERPAYFIGVDSQPELIDRCRDAASELGFDNMEFHADEIIEFQPARPIDVAVSLHACDTATDEAIAKGILLGARFLLIVPCCQRELRRQMRGHPLTGITRYPPLGDRLRDALTEALRALLMEAHGYRVDVFEFVPTSVTPKNIMLRAERLGASNQEAADAYAHLKETFGVSPSLERFLSSR
jgi:SAM-dependent methyltransferase